MYTTMIEIEVPDWVNYMAQDKDGWWNFYQNEPYCYDSKYWITSTGKQHLCIARSPEPKDYTQELYEIVRK